MLSRSTFLLCFVSILSTECIGQVLETKTYSSFPKELSLRHSKVAIREALTPNTIHLHDSVVILVDQNADPAIHFYNIKDWSLISSYGKRGDGPAEVRIPKFHGQLVYEKDNVYLWFSDFRTTKLLKLNFKDILNNINTEPETSLKMPYEVGMLYDDIFALSDTKFVGTVQGNVVDFTGENSGRFFKADVKNKSISWIPNFPEQTLENPEGKIGHLYSSETVINLQSNLLASAMRFYDRIDIVDVTENKVLTIVHEDEVEPKEVDLRHDSRLIPPQTRYYYGKGFATANHLYFWYGNFTEQQSIDYFDGKISEFPNLQLKVFDWEGYPVLKVQVDKHNLGSFFVDEKTWTLYAIDHDPEKEDEVIVSYQLPNLGKY